MLLLLLILLLYVSHLDIATWLVHKVQGTLIRYKVRYACRRAQQELAFGTVTFSYSRVPCVVLYLAENPPERVTGFFRLLNKAGNAKTTATGLENNTCRSTQY